MNIEHNSFVGSIRNRNDRKLARELIVNKHVVGMKNTAVSALVGDAYVMNERLIELKGEARASKPLSLAVESKFIIPLIDFEQVPASFREMFKDEKRLGTVFGALCFLRVPIDPIVAKSHNLPASAIHLEGGIPMVQYWDPAGNSHAEVFFEDLRNHGVRWPGITSYNRSGEKEIVSEKEALKLANEWEIYYLRDHKYFYERVKGSYAILGFRPGFDGLALLREGNIPVSYFEKVLNTKIDTEGAFAAKYPPLEISEKIIRDNNPAYSRARLIRFASGLSAQEIIADELLLRLKLR